MNRSHPVFYVKFVQAKAWEHCVEGLSLKFCHETTATCFRRLVKGTDRAGERERLNRFYQRALELAERIPENAGVVKRTLVLEDPGQWIGLTEALAKSWSDAIAPPTGGLRRNPPFLHALWAPKTEPRTVKDPYATTVEDHSS